MVHLALLNLIIYNFLQHQIKWAYLLNCWDKKTQLKFTDLASDHNIYLQVWNINQLKHEEAIEGRILLGDKPLTAVFFDFNCWNSINILNKTSSERLFKQRFHWLIYDENSNIEKFRHLFQNFHMAVDADVTLVIPNPQLINFPRNTSFILYDVYNNGYSLGGKLNMTIDREILCSPKVCNLKQYLSKLYEKSKYEHRWYLEDITMRVSTVVTYLPLTLSEEQLFEFLNSKTNTHHDGAARFGFQYLMILQEALRCKFYHNFTNIWSRTELTGGCVGAIGIENTADFSSSPFIATLNRLKYLQLIMELGKFKEVCMFRTPHNAGIKDRVFLEPFSNTVWYIFAGLLAITAVLLWLTFVVEFYQMKTYLDFIPSLLTTGLLAFGAACYQGSFIIPTSVGGRMTFICLSLFTFIIYNYYTSLVVSILLGSPVKSNIKTMGQLADSNLDVGLEPIPFTFTYLNISPLPDVKKFKLKKIESKKNPASVWLPVEQGIRRVRDNPGYVYVFEYFSGYSLIQKLYTAQEICDLNEVLFRPPENLYFNMNRNSSYREMIKLKQIRHLETGIYRRHYNFWVKSNLNCYLSGSFVVQVGLEYTAPLFIMLFAAYIAVMFLLLLELLWKRIVGNFSIKFG